jgi:hypothetical protein
MALGEPGRRSRVDRPTEVTPPSPSQSISHPRKTVLRAYCIMQPPARPRLFALHSKISYLEITESNVANWQPNG